MNLQALSKICEEILRKASPQLKEIAVNFLIQSVQKFTEWFFSKDKPSINQTLSKNPSLDEFKGIREQLLPYTNKALSAAEKLAQELISGFKSTYIDKFAEYFKPIDEGVGSELKADFERLLGVAKDAFIQNISSKISLGDNEFVRLFQQEQGEQREQNINDYISGVKAKAIKVLYSELKNALSFVFENASKSLNTKLSIAQSAIGQGERFLRDIKNAANKASKEQKQTQLGLNIAKIEAMRKALGL